MILQLSHLVCSVTFVIILSNYFEKEKTSEHAGMPQSGKLQSELKVLNNSQQIQPKQTTITTECSFGGIQFSDSLQEFTSHLDESQWQYNYATDQDFSVGYKKCVEEQSVAGLDKKSYISECFFKSKDDSNFDGMGIYARDKVIYKVRLHFKDDQSHDSVRAQLTTLFGAPTSSGHYFEEAYKHNLLVWRKEHCRIIYDHGGLENSRPVYLIIERIPAYSGGYNPVHVNFNFLKD